MATSNPYLAPPHPARRPGCRKLAQLAREMASLQPEEIRPPVPRQRGFAAGWYFAARKWERVRALPERVLRPRAQVLAADPRGRLKLESWVWPGRLPPG